MKNVPASEVRPSKSGLQYYADMRHSVAQRRELLPETAFISFKNSLEEPAKTEGFDEIRRVNFKFDGSDEERKLWSRWMT
jgi:hypothetical protein